MPSDWRSRRVFLAVAALFVLVLLRDAILHGYVLGQGELLLQFEPWRSHAPTGWRPGNPLLADSPTVFYPFLVHARKAFWEGIAPLWNSSMGRSEERRVGKECRSRWSAEREKKKMMR